jgi:long-chain fatty acid transport protein
MRTLLKNRSPLSLLAAAALAALAGPAAATNGMNMEGYGPISTGMGGASQAIDHGTAAMAQNPATLGLMTSPSRLDLAFGYLGPNVTSSVPGAPAADSGGDSYFMPALGYARRTGAFTWGVGLFAQGGMGTEYDANTFLALGSGNPVRSELGVGRLLFPLVFQVSPDIMVGGSIDFVWANLDLRWAATGAQLGGLVTGASGNLGAALPGLGGAPWARVDFSDDNDFTGEAMGTGWAFKLGAVWKAAPGLTFGASYQSKTSLGDLETGTTGASLSAAGGFADPGRVTIQDFQWPATLAIGAGWQATPEVLVAADIKRIGWSDVMESFKMRFDSAGVGGSVSFALPQQWEDQTVFNLGAAWLVAPQWTLRAGLNLADNPVPDTYVNPLFPATIKNHYTFGASYTIAPQHELHGSLTYAPEVSVTNPQGVTITHSQTNFQLMYTARF